MRLFCFTIRWKLDSHSRRVQIQLSKTFSTRVWRSSKPQSQRLHASSSHRTRCWRCWKFRVAALVFELYGVGLVDISPIKCKLHVRSASTARRMITTTKSITLLWFAFYVRAQRGSNFNFVHLSNYFKDNDCLIMSLTTYVLISRLPSAYTLKWVV